MRTSNIRIATLDDIDMVLTLCREFHEASPYKGVKFSPVAARQLVVQHISSPTSIVLVADERGFVVGTAVQIPFCPEELVATEVAWFARDGEDRVVVLKELQESFEYWARNVAKVNHIWCGSFGFGKWFTERGYDRAETMYIAELK